MRDSPISNDENLFSARVGGDEFGIRIYIAKTTQIIRRMRNTKRKWFFYCAKQSIMYLVRKRARLGNCEIFVVMKGHQDQVTTRDRYRRKNVTHTQRCI